MILLFSFDGYIRAQNRISEFILPDYKYRTGGYPALKTDLDLPGLPQWGIATAGQPF
jgi:hypothetical protein